jgi:hypothetical protein
MSGIIINLLIQLVSGAVGGNAVGGILKNLDLGPVGNSISGAIGGAAGGQILQALIPAMAAASTGGMDIGHLVSNLVGGGAAGAILTIIVGFIRNAMSGPKHA